jgi:ATP-dependent RNA helicase DDX27
MPLLIPRTIESDDEGEELLEGSASSDDESNEEDEGVGAAGKRSVKKDKKKEGKKHNDGLDPSFSMTDAGIFGDDGGFAVKGWDFKGAMRKLAEQDPRRAATGALLDARIAEKRAQLVKKRKDAKKQARTNSDAVQEEKGKGTSVDDADKIDNEADVEADGSRSSAESNSDGDEDSVEGDKAEVATDSGVSDVDDDSEEEDEEESQLVSDTVRRIGGADEEDANLSEEEMEAAKREEFFENSTVDAAHALTFQALNLSRPLLRAVEALGYMAPTAVQTMAIPHALAGRDLAASATTGSGKTAAFLLPVLERLLFRPKRVAATRVVIVTPTRELAVQIHSMCGALSRFTDIGCCLIVGGSKNLRSQEAELRSRPDIVVCTPGRMVDHITNSSGVHLDDVDILILDEADRLLELGFEDEVQEIVKMCPHGRQTMLFSATMNTKVDTLVKLSLVRPIRVEATPANSLAKRLEQEFIRIRKSREDDREAILLSLLSRTFKTKTIVFFDTKVQAHRIMLVLGLSGLKAAELHGNLTMTQRLEALERFKSGDVEILVATDLAARGLDITGVRTVINYEMPRTADTYVHRVGRTARAGCGGRSVTLIGEPRRLIMKEVLKRQQEHALGAEGEQGFDGQVQSRCVPQAVIDHFHLKISEMEEEIESIMKQEKVDRDVRMAEMEAHKALNVVEHEDEIKSRPAREWIMTNKKREEIQERSKAEANGKLAQAVHSEGKAKIKGNSSESAVDEQGKKKKTKKGEKDGHRLNRKKRRRLEASKIGEGEGGMTDGQMRLLAKKAKREAHAQKKDYDSKPLGETRGTRRLLEVGAFESDLSSRSKKKPAVPTFTEFDPSMHLRKHGKPSKSKFKSKAKFKRRK